MDTQRLILFAAFMLVSMSLWQSWQIQVNPHPVVVNTTNSNAITDTPRLFESRLVLLLSNQQLYQDFAQALCTRACMR